MLRNIIIHNTAELHHVNLIKKADAIQFQAFANIYNQAQGYAKKIIIEANKNSEEIYHQAWCEGYMSGISLAIQDLTDFIADNENHLNQIITNSWDIISSKLALFFTKEETLCQLIEMLSQQFNQEIAEHKKLTISVPNKIHQHSLKIKKIFQSVNINADVKKEPNSNIVVEYGKEIWFCNLDTFANDFSYAAVKEAIAANKLHIQCQASSISAIQHLRDTLNSYLIDIDEA